MTNREQVEQWLAAKVPGARFDSAGIASLQRDPDTQIVLEFSVFGELCHFCSILAPLDEHEPEANLLAALELNRFGKPLGGCWLAWEPEIQMLTSGWNMNMAHADEIAFSDAIDNFISAMDAARAELMRPQPLVDAPLVAGLA